MGDRKVIAEELIKHLTEGELISATDAEYRIPNNPGYYAIWVKHPSALPHQYFSVQQTPTLLYVGITTRSLRKRLFEQDLRHKNSATFFRSLGAVLGFRPPPGSLLGKSNKSNYKFSNADTSAIIEWINTNIGVRFAVDNSPDKKFERYAISNLKPPFNGTHNPQPLPCLKMLREQCKKIANSSIEK